MDETAPHQHSGVPSRRLELTRLELIRRYRWPLTASSHRKLGFPPPLSIGVLVALEGTPYKKDVLNVLNGVFCNTLRIMHKVQKDLTFWKKHGEGNMLQRVYLMIFQRGPIVFFKEILNIIHSYLNNPDDRKTLSECAVNMIANREFVLEGLQKHTAIYFGEMYSEIDLHGESMQEGPAKIFQVLMSASEKLFSEVQKLTRDSRDLFKDDPACNGRWLDPGCPMSPTVLPDRLTHDVNWSDADVQEVVNIIDGNIQKLDTLISHLIHVSKCGKPTRMARSWFHYVLATVSLPAGLYFITRSFNIKKHVCEAKKSTFEFWRNQGFVIKHLLFGVFRRNSRTLANTVDVEMTYNSLNRILLDYCRLVKGEEFIENASLNEMLDVVVSKYEKEVKKPIRNAFFGLISTSVMILFYKLKLDVETGLFEIGTILKDNQKTLSAIAALPTFVFCGIILLLGGLTGLVGWITQCKWVYGREFEDRLQSMQFIIKMDNLTKKMKRNDVETEDEKLMLGSFLYYSDRLHQCARKLAHKTGEWSSLEEDLLVVGSLHTNMFQKQYLIERLQHSSFSCLATPRN